MPGTEDSAFLKDVDDWRQQFAGILAQHHPQLSQHQVDDCAQRTIGDIIFLRLCEERRITIGVRLKDILRDSNVGSTFSRLIRKDAIDNDSVMAFDETLKDIIKKLYEPNGWYSISALSCKILGRIHEHFLEKIERTSSGQRSSAEEKSQTKKTNGVYYTPKYVVDYIVQNAVGGLLDGKTPEQVSKLRILDPACGCGAFLIGVYQKLLDWHLDWYHRNESITHSSHIYQRDSGEWCLNSSERKRILKNSIYGVDLDFRAVQITRWSLLLKALEGQDDESNKRLQPWPNGCVLPVAPNNIKCGNSLIGQNFSDRSQLDPLNDSQSQPPNAFDWGSEFPEVMYQGGFDAIIGNPPYRREIQNKRFLDGMNSTVFGRKYRTARMDFWYYFLHRGLELLKPEGVLSFITNAYWTASSGAEKLITELRDMARLDEIFYLNKLRVFTGVSGQHMILRITNVSDQASTTIKIAQSGSTRTAEPFVSGKAPVIEFNKTSDQLFRHGVIDLQPPAKQLLSKIDRGIPLSELGKIRQGIVENPPCINRKLNDKFDNTWQVGQGVFALCDQELASLNLPDNERQLIRDYYDLCDLDRYYIALKASRHLIYSTRKTCPAIDDYPIIREHLKQFERILECRRETRMGSNRWWHLHWPRDESLWLSPKIISLQMATRPSFVPTFEPVYVPFSVNVFVPRNTRCENVYYITAILNSRLIWKWLQHHAKRRGVGLEINGHVLARAPICEINFDRSNDRQRHARIVFLVQKTMSWNQRLRMTNSYNERTSIDRQINSIEQQIDSLICELYGLTNQEIRAVAAATRFE